MKTWNWRHLRIFSDAQAKTTVTEETDQDEGIDETRG